MKTKTCVRFMCMHNVHREKYERESKEALVIPFFPTYRTIFLFPDVPNPYGREIKTSLLKYSLRSLGRCFCRVVCR